MEFRSNMKKCFKCGKIKSLSEFYRHSKMKDGHLNKCKECAKIDVAANYRKNREHFIEYDRYRNVSENRKVARLQYQNTRRTSSPEKYRAYCMVNDAVRHGRLIKKPCVICGKPKTEAHHEDYNRPLDVVWLCREHHVLIHGKVPFAFKVVPIR